jgi:hypothetical protein
MILGPATGSALVGYNPRLLGVLPACAALTAFALGRLPVREAKRAAKPSTSRKAG